MEISKELGTRHRAGVGISEVTDSLTIIVSEETGTISVAEGGMLKRHLAPGTLEKLLRNALCKNEDQAANKSIGAYFKEKFQDGKGGRHHEE